MLSRALYVAGSAMTVLLTVVMAAASGCAPPAPPTDIRLGGGSGPAAPIELAVSAASSLKNVLTEGASAFEKANNVKLVFNFGASGQLVKQIEGGAPADVFLSASPAAVATLAAEGLASADASAMFAGNTLVVLVPNGNPAGIHGPDDLAKAARLTTGDPAVAPHGQKAVEWLTGLGLWDSLRPRFVFAANAAQTDEYVARGEVDAGIGFASDATGRSDLEIAHTVPGDRIKPIRYVGVPVAATSQPALARAYIAYLVSEDMQSLFTGAGFQPAPAK